MRSTEQPDCLELVIAVHCKVNTCIRAFLPAEQQEAVREDFVNKIVGLHLSKAYFKTSREILKANLCSSTETRLTDHLKVKCPLCGAGFSIRLKYRQARLLA